MKHIKRENDESGDWDPPISTHVVNRRFQKNWDPKMIMVHAHAVKQSAVIWPGGEDYILEWGRRDTYCNPLRKNNQSRTKTAYTWSFTFARTNMTVYTYRRIWTHISLVFCRVFGVLDGCDVFLLAARVAPLRMGARHAALGSQVLSDFQVMCCVSNTTYYLKIW